MSNEADLVKQLRELTQAGMMDCKAALKEANWNLDKAIEFLKKKGIQTANKLIGKETKVGRIGSYIHQGRIGVVVEVSCETDFVAMNKEFEDLLHDLCLQVAGTAPEYISKEDVPKELVEEEKKKYTAEVSGKPPQIAEKIIEGKLDKNLYSMKCLLNQQFVKDMKFKGTVEGLVKEHIAKFGENITIRRFVKFELGRKTTICDKLTR